MRPTRQPKRDGEPAERNSGGFLQGLTDIIERLNELAEKGQEFRKTGEFKASAGEKGQRGVYGFSVRVGLGGDPVSVEPFGNVRKEPAAREVTVQEVREPLVDVFEEQDHVLLVAEMPGVGREDLRIELADDILTLHAARGDTKYHKEILLPRSFTADRMKITCRNGMVEIRLAK